MAIRYVRLLFRIALFVFIMNADGAEVTLALLPFQSYLFFFSSENFQPRLRQRANVVSIDRCPNASSVTTNDQSILFLVNVKGSGFFFLVPCNSVYYFILQTLRMYGEFLKKKNVVELVFESEYLETKWRIPGVISLEGSSTESGRHPFSLGFGSSLLRWHYYAATNLKNYTNYYCILISDACCVLFRILGYQLLLVRFLGSIKIIIIFLFVSKQFQLIVQLFLTPHHRQDKHRICCYPCNC